MTEPTPTKEQIEAATDIYNTVTFDIGLTGASDARDKIAAVLVAREQAARHEALKEVRGIVHKRVDEHDGPIAFMLLGIAHEINMLIKALIDKGE